MKVSNSRIQCFKSCRRMYQLKYVFGLEPIKQSDAIERGLDYHEAVESILKTGSAECGNPKIAAMAEMFKRNFNMPVRDVEKWFSYETDSGHEVIGRIDAKTSDGWVVEHKSTSSPVDGVYLARLEMDEQIPTYMIAEDTNIVIYTVCETPTIRPRKGESPEEFKQRCIDWFDSTNKFTIMSVSRSDQELERFRNEQDAIINEMENCKLFYRNPNHCMKFGRLCEYAPICMQYAEGDVVPTQFTKNER